MVSYCKLSRRSRPTPPPWSAIGAPNDNCRPPPAPFVGIEPGPSRSHAPHPLFQRARPLSTRWIRVKRMLNAGSYKDDHHDVLTVDTRKLVERHQDHISLPRINSGATSSYARRGLGTFRSIEAYPAIRRKADVAEVVVEYHAPDIVEFTLSVERSRGDDCLETLWIPDADDN